MPTKVSKRKIWVPKKIFVELLKGTKAIGGKAFDIVEKEVFGAQNIHNDQLSLDISPKFIMETNILLPPRKNEFIRSFIDDGCLAKNNVVLVSSRCGKPNKKEMGESSGAIKALSDLEPIGSFKGKLRKFEAKKFSFEV